MSVTIIQRNKDYPALLPNSAGWQLYGHVNAVACALIRLERGQVDMPRPPDRLTKAEAVATADLIERNILGADNWCVRSLDELAKRARGLWAGDLKALVKQYADWLRNCGGYRLVF